MIYEYPDKVSFHLSEEKREVYFYQLLHDLEYKCHYGGTNEQKLHYRELCNFITANKASFYENTVSVPQGNAVVGMKLLKAFKYFLTKDEGLIWAQDTASKYIQKNKTEGTLCLSVHPLDFLSLSESVSDWRSCHALDGEYRNGNLSYMLDSCTFICYLKSDEDVILPHFPRSVPWNSKKWRVLMFLSEDNELLIAGRQYPLKIEGIMDALLKNFMPTSGLLDGEYTNWLASIPKNFNAEGFGAAYMPSGYMRMGKELIEISKFYQRNPNTCEFDDVLLSSDYSPIYAVKKKYSWQFSRFDNNTVIKVGGPTKCLLCGDFAMEGTDTMMCESCELEYGSANNDFFTFCNNCNSHIYTDTSFDVEGDTLCGYCTDRLASECEDCQYLFYDENLYEVSTGEMLCEGCKRARGYY